MNRALDQALPSNPADLESFGITLICEIKVPFADAKRKPSRTGPPARSLRARIEQTRAIAGLAFERTDRSRGINSCGNDARQARFGKETGKSNESILRCCASSFERKAVRVNSLAARKRKRKAARCACAVNGTRVKLEENRKEGSIDNDNEPEISHANAHVHVAPLGKLIRIA